MQGPSDLTGKVAIVTGAAGAVGGAIVARLVEAGANAILLGRSQPALEAFIKRMGWHAQQARCWSVDLSSEDAIRTFTEDAARLWTGVDILVHAAGVIALGSVEAAALSDLDRQYQVNIRAPFQLTQALLPSIRAKKGEIVFINSSTGISARSGVSQYAATKHALRALADSLRQEANEAGVRVLSVYLGRTASRMQAAVHEQEGRPYRPELLLQPDDVAAMVMQALLLPRTAEVTDIHIRPMRKS